MDQELSLFQIGGLLAFVASLIATRLLINAHLEDAPNEVRKIHRTSTATAGGLGVMLGLFAAIIFVNHQSGIIENRHLIFAIGLSGLLGMVGLVDDIFNLKPKLRMALLFAVCGIMLRPEYVAHVFRFAHNIVFDVGPFIGFAGTLLWLLVIVNAVNFMDGANGVAFGAISISFVGIGALAFLHGEMGGAIICFLATAAIWGFLTYNVGKGNIFAGDVGSWFIGGLFGAMSLIAVRAGVNIFAIALCALPILADVILTIIHRIKLGENILTAHSHHIYQLLVKSGKSHFYVALLLWLQTQICIALAIVGDKFLQNYQAIIFAAAVCAYIAIFSILRPALERKISSK